MEGKCRLLWVIIGIHYGLVTGKPSYPTLSHNQTSAGQHSHEDELINESDNYQVASSYHGHDTDLKDIPPKFRAMSHAIKEAKESEEEVTISANITKRSAKDSDSEFFIQLEEDTSEDSDARNGRTNASEVPLELVKRMAIDDEFLSEEVKAADPIDVQASAVNSSETSNSSTVLSVQVHKSIEKRDIQDTDEALVKDAHAPDQAAIEDVQDRVDEEIIAMSSGSNMTVKIKEHESSGRSLESIQDELLKVEIKNAEDDLEIDEDYIFSNETEEERASRIMNQEGQRRRFQPSGAVRVRDQPQTSFPSSSPSIAPIFNPANSPSSFSGSAGSDSSGSAHSNSHQSVVTNVVISDNKKDESVGIFDLIGYVFKRIFGFA